MALYIFSVGDTVKVVGTPCPGGANGWPMTGCTGEVIEIVNNLIWGKLVRVKFPAGETFDYVPDDIVIEIDVGHNGRRRYL